MVKPKKKRNQKLDKNQSLSENILAKIKIPGENKYTGKVQVAKNKIKSNKEKKSEACW
nr:hypothetical protein [Mycoplasmopsis bovis]